MVRAEDFADGLGEANNPAWKTIGLDGEGNPVVPLGSVGFRWGEEGKWNLEERRSDGAEAILQLSLIDGGTTEAVAFPYFGGTTANGFVATEHPDVVVRNVPVRRLALNRGRRWLRRCSTCSAPITGWIAAWAAPAWRRTTTRTSRHAGLGRAGDRGAARPYHPCRAGIRRHRREDQRCSMVILGAGSTTGTVWI